MVASFILRKPNSLLTANVAKLQNNIFNEIGVPNTTVRLHAFFLNSKKLFICFNLVHILGSCYLPGSFRNKYNHCCVWRVALSKEFKYIYWAEHSQVLFCIVGSTTIYPSLDDSLVWQLILFSDFRISWRDYFNTTTDCFPSTERAYAFQFYIEFSNISSTRQNWRTEGPDEVWFTSKILWGLFANLFTAYLLSVLFSLYTCCLYQFNLVW